MASLPCRLRAYQAKWVSLDEQTLRKTYKYKLKATPEQERAMAFVLRRCRELYRRADLPSIWSWR